MVDANSIALANRKRRDRAWLFQVPKPPHVIGNATQIESKPTKKLIENKPLKGKDDIEKGTLTESSNIDNHTGKNTRSIIGSGA